MIIRKAFLIATLSLALAGVCSASDFPVQILGLTNTQAVLIYNSPVISSCSVRVSTSSQYSPVVNDVNASLFTSANLDSRPGNMTGPMTRVFVMGKRTADVALDGKRYSRALQADTTYFYEITCGTNVATGQFTTKTLFPGLTYSDTIPGDASGNAAWPTIGTDRAQQFTDPQTGILISRLSIPVDGDFSFGSFGGPDVCNSTLVTDSTGALGYHCSVGGYLFWINPVTGEARPVGVPVANYDGVDLGSTGICNLVDNADPNRFYCVKYDPTFTASSASLVSVTYSGQNTYNISNLPNCTGSNQPCVIPTILTPVSTGNPLAKLLHNFDNTFDVNFNVNGDIPTPRSVQNGKIIMDLTKSGQDSYSWWIVFDPGNGVPVGQVGSTAGVVAMMPTWKNNSIVRWCSDHTLVPIGDQDFVYGTSNNLVEDGREGFGIYTTNISAGSLSASTTSCPSNPYGATQCTDITVDGEPCNPTQVSNVSTNTLCSLSVPNGNYLQSAAVGDMLGIEPRYPLDPRGELYLERLQIIAKSGNNWTIGRGIGGSPVAAHSTGTIDELCPFGAYYWDYVNDPHGTLGAAGGGVPSTIIYDRTNPGGHYSYRPYRFIGNVADDPDHTTFLAYSLRTGTPSEIANVSGVLLRDIHPTFASLEGVDRFNLVDSHSSPYVNNQYFFDGRPLNSGAPMYGTPTALGSNVYKYAVGVILLNRKSLPTFAYSNQHILQDISGPGSSITASTNYSYCYVENAGECYAGSLVGEVYAKSSTVSTSHPDSPTAGTFALGACPYPGIAVPGWDLNGICIGDNGMYTQGIIEGGATVDLNGKNGRMVTHALTTYNRQDVYWSARGLPDVSGMLFAVPIDTTTYGNRSGQLFMAKLPPFTVDAVLRNDFMQIPVTVSTPTNGSAVSATIHFGYAENGAVTNFYCTSRKEACVKGTQAGTQYDFASSSPTPVACANGCTITVPIIPERAAYLQVNYQDVSGAVVQTLSPQVVAAEPPFNVSPVGDVSLPSSTTNPSTLKGNILFKGTGTIK